MQGKSKDSESFNPLFATVSLFIVLAVAGRVGDATWDSTVQNFIQARDKDRRVRLCIREGSG